jgi:hypothetical protein
MQKELEQIIKDYNLEGTRIQSGRQRIYPQRKGLNSTPEQLENLKSVLEGNSVKGTLRITAGDVVIAANTAGAIEKAFDPGLLPNQPKSTEVDLMQTNTEVPAMESKAEVLTTEAKSEAPVLEGENSNPDTLSQPVEGPSVNPSSSASKEKLETVEAKLEPTIAKTDSKTPRQTYLDLLKQSPAFKGVDVTYEDLQELSLESMKPLDSLVLKAASQNNLSRDEAESIIGAASPYIQASVDKIQASAEQLVTPEFVSASEQTQAENEAARETYLDLLKQCPEFPDKDITIAQLSQQSLVDGMFSDTYVVGMAYEKGLSREELDRVITQGSPYVQQQIETGSLTNAREYLTEISKGYDNKLQSDVAVPAETPQPEGIAKPVAPEVGPEQEALRDQYVWLSDVYYNDSMFPGNNYPFLYEKAVEDPKVGITEDTQVTLAAFARKTPPEELEQALSQSPYVQSQIAQGVNEFELRSQYISPIISHYTEFYNEKVVKGSPEENLRRAVEKVTSQEQVTSTAAAPAEARQLDYPNTAQTIDPAQDFRDTVQRGTATLQTHAISAKETLELAQKNLSTFAKHVKHRGLKAWAKEQMPILQNKTKELVQAQAAKIGEYAKEQAPIIKDAAITGAKQVSKTVVDYAKENAPVVAEKAKALGGTIVERVYSATRLVDPTRVEALGARVLGQDGGFEGNTFHFKRTDSGIEISLKNGTPVYANGKLNPKLDGSSIYQLNQLAQKVDEFKTPTQVEEKRKAISR